MWGFYYEPDSQQWTNDTPMSLKYNPNNQPMAMAW